MDENKNIPGKGGLFEEPKEMPIEDMPMKDIGMEGGKLVRTFESEDGMKAVNLVSVETDADGGFTARLTDEEMRGYADGLMNGEEDTRCIQVGKTFDGEDAMSKAEDEATRLNEQFDPGAEATDEELAKAAMDAKGDGGFIGEEDLGALDLGKFEAAPEPDETSPFMEQLNAEQGKMGLGV